ncbi:hypothetical protein JG687_00018664, partial [Phytophthora cactorum]
IILQQDECAIPPQLILSNLRRLSDSIAPPRVYPTIQQVSNCDKYLRRLQGTKNSIQAVKRLVREHAFNPTGDANQSFIFSYHDGADGYSSANEGSTSCNSRCGYSRGWSTANHALCRVKQLQKVEDSDSQELEELCGAVDYPFRTNEDDDEEVPCSEILGPSLVAREQHARAAQLYKNVISWSL